MMFRVAAAPAQAGVATATRERALTISLGLVVAVFAALVRLVGIGDVPFGLHGDEALTGLDAQRILDEGWIGPYVYPSGLGQPAGPLYWVAAVFSVFGVSMTTLRGAIAVLGIATVVLTYVLGLLWFSRPQATIAAFLLACMPWHFHLSRTGYMVASWPLVMLATCIVLTYALRTRAHPGLSLAAGFLAGLGIYTYNAYPLTFALYAAMFVLAKIREPSDRYLARATIFAVAVSTAVVPMILYAVENPQQYFNRASGLMIFTSEEWLAAAHWWERVALIIAELGKFVVGLLAGGRPDFGDGLSSPGFPPINPLISIAAAVGFVLAWHRRFDWACAVCCAAVLIFPWGAILTTGNGDFRRTLALAPFIAFLAALPLGALWHSKRYQWTAALGAILALSAAVDILRYPASLKTEEAEHVFAPELRLFAEQVVTLPAGTQVNFFSDRWSVHYETLRFLAGDLDARDRSREFRAAEDGAWGDVTPPAAFFFLGRYLPWAPRAEERWPDGHELEVVYGDRIRFRAYLTE